MKNSIGITSVGKNGVAFRLLSSLILTLALFPTVVNAGVYKWTDQQGNVHYGSQRPDDAEAERMKLDIPPTLPIKETTEETNNKEGDKKEAELKDDGDQEKATKERTEYCANERKRLHTATSNKEIHEKDASGNVKALSAEARNQRINKIKDNIAKYCQ
ncbi:MAG: DUF4124 domain-containing protein [Gammaproteobacteria bacterium]|nr:DUF4124 domain-containing protein [Gammaproteobacteria bacterium]